LLAALLLAVSAAAAETVIVIVRKTSIRRDRQFYAPTIVEAELGDSFTVLGREKGWVKVGAGAGEGWLHESAVTAKKVTVSAEGPAGGRVDAQDVALAGKGFTPQVESEYRKKNPKDDFAAVDRMEKLGASDTAVAAFLAEGNLRPRGAGK
jgi:phage gp46-like protein